MYKIKLDFENPGLPQVLDVMQSDSQSRFIGITLYDGGVAYEAPEGAQYTVQYRGPGANNMGWYDTIQLSSGTRKAVVVDSTHPNVVRLELAEQALRVNGNVFVNLCVVNNTGYKLNTFPILCRVTGAPYVDPVAVRSYFYVTGITSEQWLAYVTACQDAQKRAEDAAATFQTDPTLSVSGKAADAAKVGEAVKKYDSVISDDGYSFLYNEKFTNSTRWDSGKQVVTATGYKTYPVIDCKKGKQYILENASGNFTYITNKTTGEVKTLLSLQGYIRNLNYDFELRITASINKNPLLYIGAYAPPESFHGYYGVRVNGLQELNNKITTVSNIVHSDTQFLPMKAENPGKYWNTARQLRDNSGYNAYDPISLKSGTYFATNISSFTFAKTDTEIKQISNGTFTIDTDFVIYTSISANNENVAMIVDNPKFIPVTKVFGSYNITPPPTFYVGKNREITSVKQGVELAENHIGATVYVDSGVYNLVEEFGTDFLDSYKTPLMIGIFLRNNVHVIFSSSAIVQFNYTGTNDYVHTYFSPFNSGKMGFTLENANVESTNCRYAIHDERNASDDDYQNVYKNCTFNHDSSNTSWGAHQALGGGLGKHGTIVIENCIAKSVGADEVISYHNANTTDNTKSFIVVKDCYLDGYFRISNFGSGTTKTYALCSNCSMTKKPQYRYDSSKADNIVLLEWNNYIRQ